MTDKQIDKIVQAINKNTEAINNLTATVFEALDGSQDKAGVKDAIFDVSKKVEIGCGAINGEYGPGEWEWE